MDSRPTGSNFATVAILAAMDDVPLTAFTMELYHALTAIGMLFFFFFFHSKILWTCYSVSNNLCLRYLKYFMN